MRLKIMWPCWGGLECPGLLAPKRSPVLREAGFAHEGGGKQAQSREGAIEKSNNIEICKRSRASCALQSPFLEQVSFTHRQSDCRSLLQNGAMSLFKLTNQRVLTRIAL
jgi:hypothetical protein